jgi:purine-binding chemotaxis protein CheW
MSTEKTVEGGQFLTFKLEEEVYALEINKVREVLDTGEVTKVPKMLDFMRGVINLRGKVVPVVDLRLKFGMTATEETVDTCIIIIEIELGGVPTSLGAMADSVQEVLDLATEQIEPAPKIGTGLDTEFIKGMGKKENEFIIILDVDRVFSAVEFEAVIGDEAAPEAVIGTEAEPEALQAPT